MSTLHLLYLLTEIIFYIFKRLDRPDMASHASVICKLFNMDRYRLDPDGRAKLRFPADIF